MLRILDVVSSDAFYVNFDKQMLLAEYICDINFNKQRNRILFEKIL